MFLKKSILVLLAVFLSQIGQAGCLEPQKLLDKGSFVVESCTYHSTTDAVYEDPRLQETKGVDAYKNPVSMLGVNKTKGTPKILSLSPRESGCFIEG
ncbi:hypothetical protein [Bdellovibrio sp. HCB209]|uniref:hypothetical protein n=1 Tax=Bdellovibrio sp. HCB209 TaxID=3394354 RepID=UPI0039B5D86D